MLRCIFSKRGHFVLTSAVSAMKRQTSNRLFSQPLIGYALFSTETPSTSMQGDSGNKSNTEEAPAANVNEQLQALKKSEQELTKQNVELKDKYLRALAEAENTRTRLSRQIEDAKLFGIQSFCKDLLEVADNLKLAANSVDESSLKCNKPLADLHSGLKLINSQLFKLLSKYGLEEIVPVAGDTFDPIYHEAVFQAKVPNTKSGSIIEIVKTGYKLHSRVIRAARVGVTQ